MNRRAAEAVGSTPAGCCAIHLSSEAHAAFAAAVDLDVVSAFEKGTSGVDADAYSAFELVRQAARAPNPDPRATFQFAYMLEWGIGTEVDTSMAHEIYRNLSTAEGTNVEAAWPATMALGAASARHAAGWLFGSGGYESAPWSGGAKAEL